MAFSKLIWPWNLISSQSTLFFFFPTLFFKEVTISISPSIPKQVWEMLFESFQETARRAKDLKASLRKNEKAPENSLERNWGETWQSLQLRALMYKRGRALRVAPENRQGSVNEADLSSTQREAWGWAPSQRGCQWSLSIFQVPPIC